MCATYLWADRTLTGAFCPPLFASSDRRRCRCRHRHRSHCHIRDWDYTKHIYDACMSAHNLCVWECVCVHTLLCVFVRLCTFALRSKICMCVSPLVGWVSGFLCACALPQSLRLSVVAWWCWWWLCVDDDDDEDEDDERASARLDVDIENGNDGRQSGRAFCVRVCVWAHVKRSWNSWIIMHAYYDMHGMHVVHDVGCGGWRLANGNPHAANECAYVLRRANTRSVVRSECEYLCVFALALARAQAHPCPSMTASCLFKL